MKTLGLYLHIPFCKSKCRYCDFCSFPHPKATAVEQYVDSLCADLKGRAEACSSHTVDTVYFGGGTPTLLSANDLGRLLDTVFRYYRVSKTAEITAECNPATVHAEALRQMRRAGFNRLSIGLQSAHENELKALGRLHSFEDFLRTWEDARAADFHNLSADVMFGIPHQTRDSFRSTLERLLALKPEHLSAYALTVEEGTAFGRIGEQNLCLPDEDTVENMYFDMVSQLEAAGLWQYEISNFAAKGYASRHNLKYWRQEEYLGLGPAAHSDFNGVRFGNGRSLEAYLAGSDLVEERGCPDERERLNEFIMLRMRLKEGICLREMADRFGEDAADRFCESMKPYVAAGFAELAEGSCRFTVRGMLVSLSILSEVTDFASDE